MTSSSLILAAVVVVVSGSLFDSSTCNHEKACFLPSDANCYMGCNGMGFSYVFADEAQQLLKIELFGNSAVDATGFYFAVGFSLDTLMGNDSVIECSSIGSAYPSLKFSYNIPNFENSGEPSNIRITNDYTSYFVNSTVTYNDGQIYCSAIVNVSGDPSNYQVFKFDQNVRYYLLMANGPTDDNGLKHHIHDVTTSSAVNLADIHPSFDPNGCGVTKGCFIPSADECHGDRDPPGMLVSYFMRNQTHLQLEIVGSSTSGTGNYVAVGFSKTGKMANTSVIECSSLGTAALSTKFSYNNAQPTNVRIAEEHNITSNYINDLSYYQDGQLFCTATVQVSGYANDTRIFTYDPNQLYYLLLARGPTNSTGLIQHTTACVAKQSLKLNQIEPYFDPSTCDQDKTCFVPTECYMGCNGMGFTFKMLNESLMKIELFSVATQPGYYVALGFSSDAQMGDDYVIECSSINNTDYSLKYSYNTGGDNPYNTRITGEEQVRSQLITNPTIAFSDGRLYCSATVNVKGVDSVPQIFAYNPKQDYYLLLASGRTNNMGLRKHFDHVVSDSPYDLLSGKTMSETNPTNFDCSQCSKKGCFFPTDTEPKSCAGIGFAYSYVNATTMDMELMGPGSSGYLAVGFSSDTHMGPAPVIECSQLGTSTFSFKFSYNYGNHNNGRITGEQPLESTYFTNTVYKVSDEQIYCKATVNVGGSNISTQVFHWDQTQNYYLIMAQGSDSSSGLNYHHQNRFWTDKALNLTAAGSAGSGGTVQQRLKQAHAIMMILAWICFVPTALLFARFLRSSWPLVKPGGLLIWFHVHRTCNLLGIALMIASFVCIMCANSWKWTGPGSPHGKWVQAHTMTGLFALIFAWMQPFVSFMRCHPNTPNRPIFNWTHRLIGVVSYILAATALGIAAYHIGKDEIGSHWGENQGLQLALVLIPIALMTIQTVLFPILDKFQEKDENHVMAEMVRQIVVLVSVGLLVGLAIALSIMVSI